MNEREKTITSLIVMLYDLNEKKLDINEKSIIESFVKKHLEKNSIKKKSIENFFIDIFIVQSNIMIQIIVVYFYDVNFQRIIEIKRLKFKRIFVDIIKTKIRLKFDNCEIKNNDLL